MNKCKLVDVKTPLKLEKPVCTITGTVPFITIVPIREHKTVYKMKCEVKKKLSCTYQEDQECNSIEYMESSQKPFRTCEPTEVHVPIQTIDHKKKCLTSKNH